MGTAKKIALILLSSFVVTETNLNAGWKDLLSNPRLAIVLAASSFGGIIAAFAYIMRLHTQISQLKQQLPQLPPSPDGTDLNSFATQEYVAQQLQALKTDAGNQLLLNYLGTQIPLADVLTCKAGIAQVDELNTELKRLQAIVNKISPQNSFDILRMQTEQLEKERAQQQTDIANLYRQCANLTASMRVIGGRTGNALNELQNLPALPPPPDASGKR